MPSIYIYPSGVCNRCPCFCDVWWCPARAQVVASTKDHKPYDDREMARIVDAGGYISMKRVDGDLAVVRADAAPVMGRHRDQATTCVTFYHGRCEVLCNFTLRGSPLSSAGAATKNGGEFRTPSGFLVRFLAREATRKRGFCTCSAFSRCADGVSPPPPTPNLCRVVRNNQLFFFSCRRQRQRHRGYRWEALGTAGGLSQPLPRSKGDLAVSIVPLIGFCFHVVALGVCGCSQIG